MFVVAVLPLFATPVLPFIDYYNHLARYHVLANIADNATLAGNYAAQWAILPNIGLDVVMTAAMGFIPKWTAAHALAMGLLAVQFGGVVAFNRALTGRLSVLVALLTVPLLYSFILTWGFANFLLGLGLVFWAAAWWLSMRHRLTLALPAACVFATIIFLVHGLAFALYGVLLGLLEIGLWLRKKERRLTGLLLAMLPLLVQAVAPVMLFLGSQTSKVEDGLTNADESVQRLLQTGGLAARLWELAQYRLVTILRVSEGPSLAFDVLMGLAVLAVLAVLVARRRLILSGVAWPAIAGLTVLVLVMPPAMFGVGYAADRLPLMLALVVVGSVSVLPATDLRARKLDNRLFGALGLLVALRLGAVGLDWHGYADDHRDFTAVAATLPPGALVETINVEAARLQDRRRCEMYGPLLIAEHNAIGRLFANESQQPLRITGSLKAAIASSPRPDKQALHQPGYFDDMLQRAAESDFGWVFLCDSERLTRPLPANLRVAAAQGRFTLLSIGAGSARTSLGG